MNPAPPATRLMSLTAYGLSALTSVLWVGLVIPAGLLPDGTHHPDAAVPLWRASEVLLPALLLLIALPVGSTLSRRHSGQMGVLASLDAFVALYTAIQLTAGGFPTDLTGTLLVAVLFGLGLLSIAEVIRALRASTQKRFQVPRLLQGARLAACLMVLIMPPQMLVIEGVERASWLGPFLLIALSTAGQRLATGVPGLRLASAVAQLAITVHLYIAVRVTIHEGNPRMTEILISGQVTEALAAVLVAIALVQVLLCIRHVRQHPAGAGPAEAAAPTGEQIA